MPDRTLIWGESESDARYQTSDDDPAGGDFEFLRDLENETLALVYVYSDEEIQSGVPFDTDRLQFRATQETPESEDPATGTVGIDVGASGWHDPIAATEDITIELNNVPSDGAAVLVHFTDGDDGGPYTVSYPSSVTWPGGTAVDEIPESGNLEVSLRSPDGGSTWRASALEDFS